MRDDDRIDTRERDAAPPVAALEHAATLAQAAELSPRAMLCGNRAGIVEWANAAWTRITGFPLSETIAKPISHFLDAARIEAELVDFVGQNFLEGQATKIVFPFETFDERSIWVELEVQPIRSALGEIEEFVAIATDISERVSGHTSRSNEGNRSADSDRHRPHHPTTSFTETPTTSLREIARREFDAAAQRVEARTHFDAEIAVDTPPVAADRLLLGETLRSMLEAALVDVDASWGFVSSTCGTTHAGRGFVSQVYPLPLYLPVLRDRSFAFVEVHDTVSCLTEDQLESIATGDGLHAAALQADSERVRLLARAAALARAFGGLLHVRSTPGCGTHALLLVPKQLDRPVDPALDSTAIPTRGSKPAR